MKNQSFNKSCKIVLNLLTFNIGKLNNIRLKSLIKKLKKFFN